MSCFGDPAVEAAVFTALAEAEVRVYRSRLLAQMNDGSEELDWLMSVSFSGDGEPLCLECGVSGFNSSLGRGLTVLLQPMISSASRQ